MSQMTIPQPQEYLEAEEALEESWIRLQTAELDYPYGDSVENCVDFFEEAKMEVEARKWG